MDRDQRRWKLPGVIAVVMHALVLVVALAATADRKPAPRVTKVPIVFMPRLPSARSEALAKETSEQHAPPPRRRAAPRPLIRRRPVPIEPARVREQKVAQVEPAALDPEPTDEPDDASGSEGTGTADSVSEAPPPP